MSAEREPARPATGEAPRPRLYLVDAMSYIFRAYHAPMAQRLASPQGVPTQAVYFFANMLRKLLREHAPDYLAVVFESKGPTFRDALYQEYKAQRPPMPDDLAVQLPYIRRLCLGLRIPILEYEGYEADDVIGTLARQVAQAAVEAVIVSSDKDMLQLVRDGVRVFSPTREKFFDAPEVEEYFGVPPEKVVEVVALMGDAIDNIPGAKGIGEKGARSLIQQYGSAEAALEHFAEVKQKNYREALRDQREQVLLSKKLATIHTDVALPVELERLHRAEPDRDALRSLFAELGFTSLLKELLAAESAAVAAAPARTDYQELRNADEVRTFLSLHATAGRLLALWFDTEGLPPLDLKLRALGFAAEPGQGYWIRLAEQRAAVLAVLRPFLEDAGVLKSVHDAKTATLALAAEGIELRGVRHDTLLYSYLLQPTTAKHTLDEVALRHLNCSVAGLGVSAALAEKADVVARLAGKLRPEVETQELVTVYERIELPLVPVLARMERAGIRVDTAALAEMSQAFEEEIAQLTRRIYALASAEFNLNSPKQLAEILFEKLNLPMPRRYARGKVASTAADVLEELAGLHELPARVLEYRELSKLKSTYSDVLPGRIHPRSGRLHTSFNQTGTATGRLSSAEPNLQNIPIRTELGNRIRAAFVAEPGWLLLSADYSQIELRVLAQLSEDPVLVEAFARGEDIHARTAQEVLGVPPLLQTPEHRRIAKMINFGIVYGLTAFGLGSRLGIEPAEAQKFIDAYFRRYAGVRGFRERLLAETRRNGWTRTLFGRIRPIPEINARNPNQRNYAERTALNSPLQGTAADLMKLAMVAVDSRLRAAGLHTCILVQVHDELLFELPTNERARAAEIIQPAMEQVYPLRVPLGVNLSVGPNWRDLE